MKKLKLNKTETRNSFIKTFLSQNKKVLIKKNQLKKKKRKKKRKKKERNL